MATSACVRFIIDREGPVPEAGRADVEKRLRAGTFFWLDILRPDQADYAMLRELFRFHPLALEDAEHLGQRAKLDDYDKFQFLVVYGAATETAEEDDLVEVHCFLSERFLVSVHRDESPAFEDVRRWCLAQPARAGEAVATLYRLVDELVDSFFPVLADFDDRIDVLEDSVFRRPDEAQLQEIFRMKRTLVGFRKAITPERDLFARLVTGALTLPGMTPDAEHYYRDVYDHLIRISDLIDSYRDLMTGTMDVYLSTVSNRLNSVMKTLTIIATIFMPLTWLTGFFGQNFGFLVQHIGSGATFVGLGLVLEVAAVGFLVYLFRRRGWL
jgi:magnesium transporter